jgi:hypothetical protein
VATVFHRRRVMPLCQRRLRLDQMTPEAPLEGVLRRARRMVGNFKTDEVDKVPMRPTQGFEPLISVFLLARSFISSVFGFF